ncbi:molybdopterin-guanine dinucleotide biosynthesis protein B [Thalassoglobus sp. JC818]|uniref:molybdopterin-guanine dinucleotide biosynthesis protein B n=1 Tax=Thalassoglobus sp. JC818 TaxID=3232136 RepID=UPI00345B10BE
MRKLHIIGRKNSGKTTLVEDLVRVLTGRGLNVGTVKHTHHHHEFDVPGKDSFRHRQAGARVVGLIGPEMAAVYRDHQDCSREQALEWMSPAFNECDFVLIEGNQHTTAAKIEVWREAVGQPALITSDPTIHAVVTDDTSPLEDCRVWKRTPIEQLADHIVSFLNSAE